MPAMNIASPPRYESTDSNNGVGFLANVHPLGGANERDHLLERLHRLRTILPVFAQEVANSRRQAAALRVENRGLVDEVRRLRRERGESAR